MDAGKKRIWGWYFYDWAAQPYSTLIVTFIFGPYVAELIGDGVEAQSAWGFGVGAAGVLIAILAPFLGALADTGGTRLKWVYIFSVFYFVGALGLWLAAPGDFNLVQTLLFFAIGIIGMEFTIIFTNSLLPDLGPPEEIGRISGTGWAFGYLGGLLALVSMLAFFADNPETGKTVLGLDPAFGLDPAAREGTRFVGPFTAFWFAIFMIPFILWVRDPRTKPAPKGAVKAALKGLGSTLRRLPQSPSLFSYLVSSMLYRDGINGVFVFGGIYAAGVLGWTVTEVGVFGILALMMGALFAWLGGKIDSAIGPKPVIVWSVVGMTLSTLFIISVTDTMVLGIGVPEGSNLPTIAFYCNAAVVGALVGTLQSASRTMMVRQANPERMTEAFGLYALSGKATAFIAPLSIGYVTQATGSQQWGIVPLIFLFILGLILLAWVKPEGDDRT